MKLFDGFSGMGGFHQAFSDHGHVCVGHCEIDPHASRFYNSYYKDHGVYYEDIRTIDTAEMPDFDIGTFGFPCQSWSIASASRRGFGDDRGNLFYEILRIVEAKRPEVILLENVRGLLNHRTEGSHSFSQMLLSISELGYNTEFALINSKFYVPQNRERVFIYATRCTGGEPRSPIFPVREGSEEGNAGEGRTVGEDVSFCIDSNYWKGANNTLKKGKRQLIQMNKPRHSNDRVYDPSGISPTLRDMSAGGNRQPYISNGVAVRRLTTLECWRLQGFSDKAHQHCVDMGISATQRYRMAGNSVSVPVVSDIAERITKQMEDV